LKLGVHISISGTIDLAVDRAVELNCETFQIFTKNPRQWKSKEIPVKEKEDFIKKVNTYDVKPVFSHASYISNLASSRDYVYLHSVNSLIHELKRCKQLEIPYLVTHIGSHLGAGFQNGFRRFVKAINKALSITKDVQLLLENAAGTKNSLGSSFEEIKKIIDEAAYPRRLGVCFDTCHAFAYGYDLRTEKSVKETFNNFNDTIGFEKLKLVHLNDSIGDLSSHLDRHEHLGMGKLGETGLKNVLKSKFGVLPIILETPKNGQKTDKDNIKKVKDIIG
jgi:deoxyribonuclease-4